MRPIRSIDLTTSILGTTYSAPFFICPAGGSKLAHPSGDLTLTQAAGKNGILHWVPNNTGCGPKQLADARTETQTLYWQIYAMEDLSVTEKEVKDAIDLGYRAFALTVDAIHVGKRERDLRLIIKVCMNAFSSLEMWIALLMMTRRRKTLVQTKRMMIMDFLAAQQFLGRMSPISSICFNADCISQATAKFTQILTGHLLSHGCER